jgi:outer membrane usher protein FimD/PapC
MHFAVFMALAIGNTHQVVAEEFEFNTDVLDVKERKNFDLSQFATEGYILPGTYPMMVQVNKINIAEFPITFSASAKDQKNSEPCIYPEIAEKLGLKESALKALKWDASGKCLLSESLEGITVKGDLATSSLVMSIPQVFLEFSSPDWDPPSRWDNGIPGVIFDYNLNAQTNRRYDDDSRDNSLSGNGTVGANVGPWRLRADWQAQLNSSKEKDNDAERDNGRSSGDSSSHNMDWSRIYAYRAIAALRAKLTVGEDYLDSDMFDGFRFAGASLVSDDNMLPPNLRGYAPEVSGVANSDAKVIISQEGRVLYEQQVAAGPFRIQNLNDAVSGKLDVRVEEQNGKVQIFQVNTANVPYLTRPGSVRYKLALGQPTDFDHHVDGPAFLTGEYSWGVSNGWSLYGGGMGSEDYNALAIGVGRDLLVFGALSFDVTKSWAHLPGENNENPSGASYRLSYSKEFEEYDSQVTFASYRFSDRDYMSMDEFLSVRNEEQNQQNNKETYTLSFNKNFPDLGASVYLNYSRETYWDEDSNNRYDVSISRGFDWGSFKGISVSLTAYRSQYRDEDDTGFYLSLSLPVGDQGRISYSSSVGQGSSNNMVSYYDQIDEHNNYQVSAGYGDNGNASGSFSHEGSMADVDVNASYEGGSYSSLGLSLRGGLTATAKGVALHPVGQMGGTRLLVDTDDVSGVPVQGYGASVDSNHFGTAVIADVNSYYRTTASVDLENLPDNVEATNSVTAPLTLTEGAIGYRKLGVIAGEKAMAIIRLRDGSSPPLGALVVNGKDQQTGVVDDGGNVYLSGIQPNGKMDVKWDDKTRCTISLPEKLPTASAANLLLPCIQTSQ